MNDVDTDTLAHRWFVYAKGQFDEGQYGGAYESFDEALRAPGTTDEHRPGIWYFQAACLAHLHRVDEADALAAKAGPEFDSAYQEHRKAAAADSLGHRWYEHAKAKYDAGHHQEAFDAVAESLQAPGTDDEHRPGLFHLQALCLLHLGRRQEADALSAQAGAAYRDAYEAKLHQLGLIGTGGNEGESMAHQLYIWAKGRYDVGAYQEAYDGLAEALLAPGTTDEHKPGLWFVQALCLLHLDRVDEGDAIAATLGGDHLSQYDAKKRELGL